MQKPEQRDSPFDEHPWSWFTASLERCSSQLCLRPASVRCAKRQTCPSIDQGYSLGHANDKRTKPAKSERSTSIYKYGLPLEGPRTRPKNNPKNSSQSHGLVEEFDRLGSEEGPWQALQRVGRKMELWRLGRCASKTIERTVENGR